MYNTADVVISGLIISANGLGGTTSSGGGANGGIVLNGTGRLVFSNGGNTYMGDTVLNGGILEVTSGTGTPAGGGAVTRSAALGL